jgi:hypothetical protein
MICTLSDIHNINILNDQIVEIYVYIYYNFENKAWICFEQL